MGNSFALTRTEGWVQSLAEAENRTRAANAQSSRGIQAIIPGSRAPTQAAATSQRPARTPAARLTPSPARIHPRPVRAELQHFVAASAARHAARDRSPAAQAHPPRPLGGNPPGGKRPEQLRHFFRPAHHSFTFRRRNTSATSTEELKPPWRGSVCQVSFRVATSRGLGRYVEFQRFHGVRFSSSTDAPRWCRWRPAGDAAPRVLSM